MNNKSATFVIFLLHRLALVWNMPVPNVYKILKKTNILSDYLLEFYDVLHSQGAESIVNDVTELARKRGVAI